MRCRMRNPRELKVRRYAARMIDINEYLSALSGANASEKLVIRNWTNFFAVFQMDVSSRHTCAVRIR